MAMGHLFSYKAHDSRFNAARAILLLNDNILAWATKADDISSIDFWGSLLGQLCTTSPHPIEKSPWDVFLFM
jgi:hypothetical protein